jgi:protein-L-isoaspartate(D-aspartate) O-methyltransferase
MVRNQVERRGVRDPRVLRALECVPREDFVPPAIRHRAYDDAALPIDCGQTISQPYVVGRMCEALGLEPAAGVLEIGTGSGYAAAVLARLAARVDTVERHAELAEAARERLAALGIENVRVHVGDGSLGWPEHAPYDAILVSAGAPDVPPALLDQLAVGGNLVLPVGPSPTDQELVRVHRQADDTLRRTRLGAVRFVPLVGEEGWSGEDAARPGWLR